MNDVAVGQRFGRLVVTNPEVRVPKKGRASGVRGAEVRCDCGETRRYSLAALRRGQCVSCGCFKRDRMVAWSKSRSTHHLSRDPRFPRWSNMMRRCHDSVHPRYADYGGRGIQVHPDWHDPQIFLDWVDLHLGPCPEGHSMDRIDNDGHYEPGNLRWASAADQNANRRKAAV